MRPHLRYLRIGWTVLCVLATVLLIALWVRSYWHCDLISRNIKGKLGTVLGSNSGTIYFSQLDFPALNLKYPGDRGWTREVLEPTIIDTKVRWALSVGVIEVRIPHWFLVLPIAGIAAAPWLHWRFSLRTLLIATTLVALVLGVILYASR